MDKRYLFFSLFLFLSYFLPCIPLYNSIFKIRILKSQTQAMLLLQWSQTLQTLPPGALGEVVPQSHPHRWSNPKAQAQAEASSRERS